MTDVFDRIYRTNGWHGIESRSGPGSGSAATARIADALVALVAELGIRSVIDVGCGDGFWMPALPGYCGVDVSEKAIELARANHPDRRYWQADIRHGGPIWRRFLEEVDLTILRDAIQHLPLVDGVATVRAVRSRWLLASTFDGGENVDITAGDAYSPDLTAPPFSLGEPQRRLFDGWGYEDGTAVRDPRKHLGLWRL